MEFKVMKGQKFAVWRVVVAAVAMASGLSWGVGVSYAASYGRSCQLATRYYPQGRVQPGDEKTVLRRGNSAEPSSLDTAKAEDNVATYILMDLFDGLTRVRAPDGKIVLGAADKCWVSKNGLKYTFHIRDDAKWSNGNPVLAENFVNAIRRSVDPKVGSTYAFFFFNLVNGKKINEGKLPVNKLGVRALNKRTIQFDLKKPQPYFLALLAQPTAFPISNADYKLASSHDQSKEMSMTQPGNLVSNGAYKLTSWVVNDHITVEKNPYYWDRDHVRIAKVVFYPYKEDVEVNAFKSHRLDWTFSTTPDEYRYLKKRDISSHKTELLTSKQLATYYYLFNLRYKLKDGVQMDINDPKLDSAKGFALFTDGGLSNKNGAGYMLRKALTMAIDRHVLTRDVLGQGQIPLYSLVPEGIPGVKDVAYDWSKRSHAQNVKEARSLFEKALNVFYKKGYLSKGDPLTLTLKYNTLASHKTVALALQAMWRQAFGNKINVHIENEEWKAFLNDRHQGHYQMARGGWVGDYNYVDTFLQLFDSDNAQNDSHYKSLAFDAAYHKAQGETNINKREKLMTEALKIGMDDYPILPLYQYTQSHLVRCNLMGYRQQDFAKVAPDAKFGQNLLDNVHSSDLWYVSKKDAPRCQKYLPQYANPS